MFKPDAANFNRFLTSLGLLLIAASLLIPYLYFKNTSVLEIPRARLEKMTATGRDTLASRQGAISSLEPWVIVVSALGAVLGIGLLVGGGNRLRKAQETEDEEGRLRRDRTRLEMRQLSPAEKAEQISEKARGNERAQAVGEGREVQRGRTASSTNPLDHAIKQVDIDLEKRKAQIARIQERFGQVFDDYDLGTHALKFQMSISSVDDAINIDGVFESATDQVDDVLLDIVASDLRFVRHSRRARADELIALVARYEAMRQRQASGWLLVVIPVEFEAEVEPEAIKQAAAALGDAIRPLGFATVVKEGEMSSLPKLFEDRFARFSRFA